MKVRTSIVFLLMLLLCVSRVQCREWRFDVDRTSVAAYDATSWIPGGVGVLDGTFLFLSVLESRAASYLRFGAGPAFSDDYYFLIPELESSFHWYTGVELTSGAALDSTRVYTNVELAQVVAGDRYHRKRWAELALGEVSRLVLPIAGVPYFLHRPSLRFSADAADDPFWSVLQAHLGLTGALEVGHAQALGLWAFPVANASLNVLFPVVGEYLYVGVAAHGTAVFPGFTPVAVYPAGAYAGYDSALDLAASIELRSRFLKFELLFPMSLELVLFGAADVSSPSLDVTAFGNASYHVGAYVEQAGNFPSLFSYRLQVGASWDVLTGAASLLFTIQ